ncbi:MAG: nickel transporter [Betaproteobacteria bacterium RIFCSPLOWO2_02_FULL_65_24]|nr:MAG: nickel transporter [Betaproteobacteria bacterium RIFCSPLOWO2_02_FULL_65_24]OGA95393.1 MAG: nickel transporter [Betaproteobacteria bacterium RIFCSPLOWO2_12_FULL_66_14]
MTLALPQDALGLMLIVLVLGVKHGMDPDHLATIDGLTRFNALTRPRLARWAGFLFSLGHGAVVTLVAALVGMMASDWAAPPWLEHLGAWISILFLTALGFANLRAVLRTPADRVVLAAGLKSRWLGKLAEASHPVVIASIGAAFALSFDTWSQAALFSLTASHIGGWPFSLVLGLVFMAGMLFADGVNGLWVARLLRRADRRALIASRVMSLTIGFLSLGVAALGLVRYFVPERVAAGEGAGLLMGLGVMAVILACFALAMHLARPRELAP